MTQVIACALQLGGMPVPKGGGVRARRRPRRNRARRRRRGAHAASRSSACSSPAGSATAVRLAGGETIRAERAVVAGVTPTQLYGQLLGAGDVPAEVARCVRALPLRARRDADPHRDERARPTGTATSASVARRSCTSRPASTASRAPSTRPSAGSSPPRRRSSAASRWRSTRRVRRTARGSSGSSSRSFPPDASRATRRGARRRRRHVDGGAARGLRRPDHRPSRPPHPEPRARDPRSASSSRRPTSPR